MRERYLAVLHSYRWRLALGYLALVLLLATAWAWSLYGPLNSAIYSMQRSNLVSVARAAGVSLASRPAASSRTVAKDVVRGSDLRVTVVAKDGRVLADSAQDPAAMENHATRPEVAAALQGQVGYDVRTSNTLHDRRMYVAIPALLSEQPVALRVSEPITEIGDLAAGARRIGLLLLLVALAVAVPAGWLLSRAAADPVARLARTAESLAAGDFGAPVPHEHGELGVLSEALTDLGEQMRMRIGELETEQRSLRALIDGLKDAVLLVEGGTVRVANRAAGDMFAKPSGGWRGKRLFDSPLPAPVKAAVAELSREQGGCLETLLGPAGRAFRVTVLPLQAEASVLAIIEDVTERARLDRMRTDFVANASHELKTPTQAIQLLAESAESAAADGETEQAETFLRQIREEASRLRRLVLDLLDLSRVESSVAGQEATEVRPAVELSTAGHRPSARAKGLNLEILDFTPPAEEVFASVDATDLAIALDNLLDNAITYTESGSVTLETAATADEVVLTVSDTGIGIPQADLPRVFERFYRVDRARSRQTGGTGLGLSLVRHVVERSGGRVSLESTEGVGTVATLRFRRVT